MLINVKLVITTIQLGLTPTMSKVDSVHDITFHNQNVTPCDVNEYMVQITIVICVHEIMIKPLMLHSKIH